MSINAIDNQTQIAQNTTAVHRRLSLVLPTRARPPPRDCGRFYQYNGTAKTGLDVPDRAIAQEYSKLDAGQQEQFVQNLITGNADAAEAGAYKKPHIGSALGALVEKDPEMGKENRRAYQKFV